MTSIFSSLRSFLPFIICVLLISACTKQEAIQDANLIDLSTTVELQGTNTVPKAVFNEGDPMLLSVSFNNINTTKSMRLAFANVKCNNPLNGFTVVDSAGKLMGDFVPDSFVCQYDYVIDKIAPRASLNYSMEWKTPVTDLKGTRINPTLTPGKYVLKYKTGINVHSNSIQSTIILEDIPFQVN